MILLCPTYGNASHGIAICCGSGTAQIIVVVLNILLNFSDSRSTCTIHLCHTKKRIQRAILYSAWITNSMSGSDIACHGFTAQAFGFSEKLLKLMPGCQLPWR